MRSKAASRMGLAVLLLTGLTLPASATLIAHTDAAQLVDKAELIFVGRAVDRQVVTTLDGKYPLTFITFDVQDVLKNVKETSQTRFSLYLTPPLSMRPLTHPNPPL